MERLICKALLWKFGLTDGSDYSRTLDEIFLSDVNNDLLLELESCSSYDYDTAFDILQRFWKYECKNFSVDIFGRCLTEDLKTVYESNDFPIEDFGRKCYSIWQQLPNELNTMEPFHTLCYADDPLSWGDEEQARKIYEEFFEFYK